MADLWDVGMDVINKALGRNTGDSFTTGEFGTSTPAPEGWTNMISKQAGFNPLASGGGPTSTFSPNWLQSLTGYTDKATGAKVNGWGGLALGAAQGIGSAYMGSKQLSLAQDTFKENKRQFQLNYDNQKKNINTQLEDRQRARVASNSGAYQSVGEYMNKNGL